ncbi:ferredoxin [Streptomyces sp. CBMA123]|uniref:ferredoxin n=1 Tax=Streptomyces sp. CBMA123 TaxID=1896313 RepID=UPI00294FF352|nr:ferredoxin [Streptomyces sp. CBMA123]
MTGSSKATGSPGPAGLTGSAEAGTDTAGAGADTADAVVVRVDRDRCIGSGMCALSAPESLTLGADGLAQPVAEYADGGAELTDGLAEAVEFCPVEALVLHSARGGYRIAPAE